MPYKIMMSIVATVPLIFRLLLLLFQSFLFYSRTLVPKG
jgi:hypothetical protein